MGVTEANLPLHETFVLHGALAAPGLVPWIDRHVRRLGLAARIIARESARVEMAVSGPPDLLDALEMGCILGPIEVWVETIERLPVPIGVASAEKSG